MSGFDQLRIRSVHLELTTRCNALCPMCARTGRGRPREGLAMRELSLADIQAILPPAVVSTLEGIDLCGAFGDPLMARDLDAILRYVRASGEAIVDIYTNGSLRSARWWTRLPALLGPRGKVCFGIDGLADTNALHRVGTSFSTILRNASAFIGAGGRAQWDFLAFRHNAHQVEAARRLSRDLGFESFSVKVSGRFFRHLHEEMPGLDVNEGDARFPVFDPDGMRSHDLEPPEDPAYRNPAHARMRTLVAEDGSLMPSFDRSAIRCLSIERGGVFVSAEGTVFPCCWTYIASKNASIFGLREPDSLRVARLLDAHGGMAAIDARGHPLGAIVAGPFFAALSRSWSAPSVAEGKPKVCARTCGGCFSPKDAYAEPRLSPYERGGAWGRAGGSEKVAARFSGSRSGGGWAGPRSAS